MASRGPNISTNEPQGATVRTFYVEREIKVYALHEYEVDNISSLNGEANIFFSVGSIILTLGFSIKFNAIFYTELTPEGKIAESYGFPILLGIGVVFVLLGIRAIYKRSSALKKIKGQSRLTGAS